MHVSLFVALFIQLVITLLISQKNSDRTFKTIKTCNEKKTKMKQLETELLNSCWLKLLTLFKNKKTNIKIIKCYI